MLPTLVSFLDAAIDSRGAKFHYIRSDESMEMAGRADSQDDWCHTCVWCIEAFDDAKFITMLVLQWRRKAGSRNKYRAIIRYAKHIYLPEPHTRKRAITAVKAEEVVSTKLMTRAFFFMIVLKKSDMQLLF